MQSGPGQMTQANGSWIFGNWTQYTTTRTFASGCVDRCPSTGLQMMSASSGIIGLGDPTLGISYAPGTRCTWEIAPSDWPSNKLLSLTGQIIALANKRDSLSAVSPSGAVYPWPSCAQPPCGPSTVLSSQPVMIVFDSSAIQDVGAAGGWAVTWTLVDVSQASALSSTATFLWVGLGMLLVPILSILAMVIRCYLRRNLGREVQEEGRRVRHELWNPPGVDIKALEASHPTCLPTVIGAAQEDLEGNPPGACSVCLGEFQAGDTVRALPCRHQFHRQCIDDWLARSVFCPMCRSHVSTMPSNQAVVEQTQDFISNLPMPGEVRSQSRDVSHVPPEADDPPIQARASNPAMAV